MKTDSNKKRKELLSILLFPTDAKYDETLIREYGYDGYRVFISNLFLSDLSLSVYPFAFLFLIVPCLFHSEVVSSIRSCLNLNLNSLFLADKETFFGSDLSEQEQIEYNSIESDVVLFTHPISLPQERHSSSIGKGPVVGMSPSSISLIPVEDWSNSITRQHWLEVMILYFVSSIPHHTNQGSPISRSNILSSAPI